jgi:hypothetical protein
MAAINSFKKDKAKSELNANQDFPVPFSPNGSKLLQKTLNIKVMKSIFSWLLWNRSKAKTLLKQEDEFMLMDFL